MSRARDRPIAKNGNDQRKPPEKDGRPRRCGARNRRGVPCARFPTSGSRRCHFHGGAKAKLPSGDPGRGGRPVVTGLYARHLTPEVLEAFLQAQVDSLDAEIRVAKAYLDWAIQQHMAEPTGGVVVSRGDNVVRERLWVDIVQDHLDKVRRLVKTRSELLRQEAPGDEDLDLYDQWIAEQRVLRPSGRSSSGSGSR